MFGAVRTAARIHVAGATRRTARPAAAVVPHAQRHVMRGGVRCVSQLISQMEAVFNRVKERDPNEKDFQQAVREVLFSLEPVFAADPEKLDLFRQLLEPERIIQVRVPWEDRNGAPRVNRGWRVQYSQALGPFKGGTRFYHRTDMSTIKFLAFEQTLTNALIPLPVGGAFGGADFDLAGKTNGEVQRFCQSYMTELYRDIGPDVDVLDGDLGCGPREIGFMFGQYKRLSNRFAGAFTGKGEGWGGSAMRTEATGFGVVYFAEHMLNARGESLAGKTVCVSGAGQVGGSAVLKLIELGAKAVTMSDSGGCVYDPDGFTVEKWRKLREVQAAGGSLREYSQQVKGTEYTKQAKPWAYPCDIALPCAIENDILATHAHDLVAGGCSLVVEGANMPSHDDAVKVFRAAGMDYVPAKAASAGGAVVSGFEMAQNAQFMTWTNEELDRRLRDTMALIHDRVVNAAASVGHVGDLKVGANVASFNLLADAIRGQGLT